MSRSNNGRSSGRGRGRSGGRGGGGRSNDNNNSSEKSNKKPNGKGIYKDGHFVGARRNQPAVTAASATRSKDFEDLKEAIKSWCKEKPHTQKVGTVIKNEKDKMDWIPAWPNQTQWGHEEDVPMRDEKGNVLKNLD